MARFGLTNPNRRRICQSGGSIGGNLASFKEKQFPDISDTRKENLLSKDACLIPTESQV